MARLSNLPKNTLLRNMPERDKLREAIQFLKANPEETPTTTARAYCVRNEDIVRKA
jgi:RNA polymerase-interacting CarD/CdnL/TRCF family regulator